MRHSNCVLPSADGSQRFLSESFDRKTLLEMEVALDRASKELPADQHDHENRTFIANRIIQSVAGGVHTEDAMISAAMGAVNELVKRQASA